MHIMLHEIAELLRARGLTIDTSTDLADAAEQVWHVSDVPEETVKGREPEKIGLLRKDIVRQAVSQAQN